MFIITSFIGNINKNNRASVINISISINTMQKTAAGDLNWRFFAILKAPGGDTVGT